MKTYQNSDVCKQSINFVTKIYQTISAFSNEEKFGLTSQLKRASISIPLNIAEGATRKGKIEFKQFLYIGLASASGIETQLIIVKNLNFISNETTMDFINE